MSVEQPLISIITPVYACEGCLNKLYERLTDSLSAISDNFEIIMVNDGSPDEAWQTITRLAKQDRRVVGINLSRNFGQHHAILAGLDYCRGQWAVVMDCDLQDQPEEIPKLFEKAQQGFDVVFGRRKVRQDNFFKKLGSRIFYRILAYFADQKFDASVANFSIVSEKVVKSLVALREQNRNYPLSVRWLGFDTAYVDIEHASRYEGPSAYTVRKLAHFAYDIIISHSNKPLRLSITIGFVMAIVSMMFAARLVFLYIFEGMPVAGWTSTMVSIYFVGGILLANMGVLGLYLGKTFNEGKGRPIYVVSDVITNSSRPEEEQ